jgi:hypothetical protein
VTVSTDVFFVKKKKIKDEMIATEDTIQVTPPRPRKEKKNRQEKMDFHRRGRMQFPRLPFSGSTLAIKLCKTTN